jgi:two-component system response regulator FixJ
MSEETTVYVVDSDPADRISIAAVAKSKGVTVREFESSEAFLAELSAAKRACVILDADQDFQLRLQQSGSSPPVVMVGPGDVRAAVRAMQQGAVSYLAKPVDPDELSAAIDIALQRAGKQALNHAKQDLRTRFEQLTASEREVLSRVIDGQPNRRIAGDLDLGLRTVELRRSNIMRKTGAANLSELIRLAIEVDFPNGLASPAVAREVDKTPGEPNAEWPD